MQPYNPDWQDMSDYVVHFTKSSEGKTAYDNMLSILWERVLHAVNPFGFVRESAPNPDNQRVVCFSEIPLHLLERLAARRGDYGIGFTKEYILKRGGGPIWYVAHQSLSESAIQATIQLALLSDDPSANPIWMMTPFIDSSGDYLHGVYRFEWEREWRHIGALKFSEKDVAFLIIPEEFHDQARCFFEEALHENTGPAYLCPFIDVGWDHERIRIALEQQAG
jgi:hypothetical protein